MIQLDSDAISGHDGPRWRNAGETPMAYPNTLDAVSGKTNPISWLTNPLSGTTQLHS